MGSIDFDDYSKNYDSLLENLLAPYGGADHFGRSKVLYMRKFFSGGHEPSNILDFGCGTGRNLPYLKEFFPGANLFAFDISKKCLTAAVRNNPGVTPLDEKDLYFCQNSFEAVFISGVFHHVEPGKRGRVLEQLACLTHDDGRIIVFEHNPFNPVTCRIVRRCVFDEDAVLITKRDLIKIFAPLLSKIGF